MEYQIFVWTQIVSSGLGDGLYEIYVCKLYQRYKDNDSVRQRFLEIMMLPEPGFPADVEDTR